MRGFIVTLFAFCTIFFISCVSSNVEEFHPEDYGYFDYPKDVKIYKASSDGMIDSTQYYANSTYNSLTKTTTTNVNKTGWARMTTKSEIKNDCLKNACKKSSDLGYDYILILDEYENVYEEWSDVRYNYQVLFIPLDENDITPETKNYKVYKNTLYYKTMKQRKNNSTSTQKNQNKNTSNLAINNQQDKIVNYSENGFSVEFGYNKMIVNYEILFTKQEVNSVENELNSMGYTKDLTYFNNTNLSLAVIEGMKHFNALGCYGEAIDNNYNYIVINYFEDNSYNTSIFTKK